MQILDLQQTPIGTLCLRRRELLAQPGTAITEVTLDHILLMSSHHTISEQALASEALARHSSAELRVLVGGLGLGYTAAEVLRSGRAQRVEVIERLPQVIAWLARDLVPLAAELRTDPRLAVREGDVFAALLGAVGQPWDLILIDVDHAPDDLLDPISGRFYSAGGLRQVAAHLAPGGILAVWSSARSEDFPRALEQVFVTVECERIRWWNDLVDEEKEDILFLARGPREALS